MKVAIVGYDVEGQASYRHFAAQGADITIFDELDALRVEPPQNTRVVLGEEALDQLADEQFDVVMRTPGLSPYKLKGVANISSGTKEFFKKCPASIIGVTGTKGKGTTCSFITEILKAGGETVHLVGNIGRPALDVLPDINPQDIVIYELSSSQLWDMDDSPHVAVVLMIEPDHLDVHPTFQDYISAKGNICRWQKPTDVVVYNSDNKISTEISGNSSGTKLGYNSTEGVHVKEGYFCIGEQKLCSTSTVVIPGKHNLDNAAAAISAAWQYVRNTDAIANGLNSFRGLPHRLKFVREVGYVKYYDDSIATTAGSAVAAMNSFDQPKVLILGGSDKGTDYSTLAKSVAQKSNTTRSIICIGQTGPAIAKELKAAGVKNIVELNQSITMHDIVNKASEIAQQGDVVILSPASASFDMFKSYKDRGEQFVAAVENLQPNL